MNSCKISAQNIVHFDLDLEEVDVVPTLGPIWPELRTVSELRAVSALVAVSALIAVYACVLMPIAETCAIVIVARVVVVFNIIIPILKFQT